MLSGSCRAPALETNNSGNDGAANGKHSLDASMRNHAGLAEQDRPRRR
jgi:hypothetical protein